VQIYFIYGYCDWYWSQSMFSSSKPKIYARTLAFSFGCKESL